MNLSMKQTHDIGKQIVAAKGDEVRRDEVVAFELADAEILYIKWINNKFLLYGI